MEEGVGTIINKSTRSINSILQGDSNGLRIKIIVSLYVFLWIMTIIGVAKDISHRSNSTMFQITCIIIVTLLSPALGLPIYLIIRPPHYKHDTIPRRETLTMGLIQCYNCDSLNPKENNFCKDCGEPLKLQCKHCENICLYYYKFCPHCGGPTIE